MLVATEDQVGEWVVERCSERLSRVSLNGYCDLCGEEVFAGTTKATACKSGASSAAPTGLVQVESDHAVQMHLTCIARAQWAQ